MRKISTTIAALAMTCVAQLPGRALGQINSLSVSRSVTANAKDVVNNLTNKDVYVRRLTYNKSVSVVGAQGYSTGSADQNSVANLNTLSGTLDAGGITDQYSPPPRTYSDGNGISNFDVIFTVAMPWQFTVSGQASFMDTKFPDHTAVGDVGSAEVMITLTNNTTSTLLNQSDTQFDSQASQRPDPVPISFSSVLLPGNTYEFVANVTGDGGFDGLGSGGSGFGTLNFSSTFAVPVPEPVGLSMLTVTAVAALSRRRSR